MMTNENAVSAIAALAWISLAVAGLCAMGALAAGPGYRLGAWTLGAGIQLLRWSATIALGAAAVALATMLFAARTRRAGTRIAGATALAVAALTAAPPLLLYWRASQLPRIHDISTDTENPPRFVAVLPLRQGANPTDYGAATAEQQKRAYPDIAPALLPLPPEKTLARAEAIARSMGWQIVAVDRAAGRIEATATTRLFGFQDDVAIRVVAHDGGSRVDVRSTSRVGVSDIGTNAARVRAFVAELQRAE